MMMTVMMTGVMMAMMNMHQYKSINTSSLCSLLTPFNGHDCIKEIRYC